MSRRSTVAADVPRVGVVGGGQMGSGITEVFLRAGAPVHLVEHDPACAADAAARVRRSLDRAVARAKLSEADRDAAIGRLSTGADLGDLADRSIVVEAVVEDETVKTEIFATLDKVVEDPIPSCGWRSRPTGRPTCWACTSSTPHRCSTSSRWCPPCSPRRRRGTGRRLW